MANIKYSSYNQIDAELEILKIQKEIHYQKIVLNFQKSKDSLTPNNFVFNVIDKYNKFFTGTFGSIVMSLIPLILGRFINKKKSSSN